MDDTRNLEDDIKDKIDDRLRILSFRQERSSLIVERNSLNSEIEFLIELRTFITNSNR